MTLRFEVTTGTAFQRLEIVDNQYSDKDIIEGLNEGRFVTTTWYNKGENNYVEDLNGNRIAEILSTSIDGEYEYFK